MTPTDIARLASTHKIAHTVTSNTSPSVALRNHRRHVRRNCKGQEAGEQERLSPGKEEATALCKQHTCIASRLPSHRTDQPQETPSEAGDSARESETPAPQSDSNNEAQAVKPANLLTVDDIANQYDLDDPVFEEYKSVFEKFREPTEEEAATKDEEKPEIYLSDDDIPDEDEDDGKPKLSKKQRKQMNKLSVAQLKSLVPRPELVEWTDVSSSNPQLLISIKGAKNVIPVPTHWSLKREYLSSKRGIEKPPFALPKFIQETGIAEMRDAVLEKQADMTMRQK